MKATKEIAYNKTHNLKVEGELVEKKRKTTTKNTKKPTIRDILMVMAKDIADIKHRLDKVEQRLDKVEQRLDKVEQRLDRVEQRLDRVEQRLDRVEQRLDKVEQRLDNAGL